MLEQLGVLTIMGLLSLLAFMSARRLIPTLDVAIASQETIDLIAYARDHAISTGRATAVRIDAARARIAVHDAGDTVAEARFGDRGVRLLTTRDSLGYAPTGLGIGAANLRITLTHGVRADTITVSRLGRVQRR